MASADDFFQKLKNCNDALDDIRIFIQQLSNTVPPSLNQLVTLTAYDAQALFQNALQNATIICILENISKQTCELLNQACLQTALQTQVQKNTAAIADLVAAAHPEAALIRDREQALRTELEKCCPPPAPMPCCQY